METAYKIENATGSEDYGWFYLGITSNDSGRPGTVFVALRGQGSFIPSHLVYDGQYRIVDRKPVAKVLE